MGGGQGVGWIAAQSSNPCFCLQGRIQKGLRVLAGGRDDGVKCEVGVLGGLPPSRAPPASACKPESDKV